MANEHFKLGEDQLTAEILFTLASQPSPKVMMSSTAIERVVSFRALVSEKLASGATFYGINTGFGYLADVRISDENLSELQVNLVRSHAAGVGAAANLEVVRALLILRLHTFCLGHSGISLEVCQLLLAILQRDILPVIPEQGSVGASGDLAPLAHLALAVIGEGEVFYQNRRQSTAEVFAQVGLHPVALGPKEGLSITNGTHFMCANAGLLLSEAEILTRSADVIAAMSLDAFKGTAKAFNAAIHQLKAHPGQLAVADNLARLFALPDAIMESHANCGKVQDPYSFRCIPQVHGASRDALQFVRTVIDRELNSVTDNPLIFADGTILSGGNFHGQALSMAMDFMGIAVAEIASISEQRIMKLTNPQMSGLPAFLVGNSGLNSGYMIPHVTAAALVSENKVLAHPAVVDSIPTSADKEDHVSMGPIAARKARQIIRNSSYVLAIELLAGCQGVDLHDGLRPNKVLSAVYDSIRKLSPLMSRDRSLSKDIEVVAEWIKGGGILTCVKQEKFPLN